MNRSVTISLCIGATLLTGCLHTAASPQATVQSLTQVYTEKYPSTIRFLEYADNGQTFIVAGAYRFINLYDTSTFKKLATFTSGGIRSESDLFDNVAATRGAGYIDNNTWYFAADEKEVVASIQQIDPPLELYKHNLGAGSSRPVIANKNYVAYLETLVNWHDGTSYKVAQAHPGSFGYTLAGESQVMTYNGFNGDILLHDPIKQKSVYWNAGFSLAEMALSADAKYAAALSDNGKCSLWRLPEKERIGSCGFGGFLNSKLTEAVFQRDSRAFAVSVNNEIRVYATQPVKLLMKAAMLKPVTALALSEGRLAAADEDLTVQVWDTADGVLLGRYASTEPDGFINKLAFQPGGTHLAVSMTGQHLSQLIVFDLDAVTSAQPALAQ